MFKYTTLFVALAATLQLAQGENLLNSMEQTRDLRRSPSFDDRIFTGAENDCAIICGVNCYADKDKCECVCEDFDAPAADGK